ncbi:hypothetical protein [Vibrio breoganii]|uniref:hypothetical protein n=1 Tax=Vibrio breoganii TaxID=553239 RepID=UPI0013000853|nr:hypothetical protein [Vibrio breoganii]
MNLFEQMLADEGLLTEESKKEVEKRHPEYVPAPEYDAFKKKITEPLKAGFNS